METILFLIATESDGSLHKSALESVEAARSLAAALGGAKLLGGVIGADLSQAAARLAGCGAEKVFGVAGETFGQSRYATDALAAEAIARAAGATVILAPATSRLSRALPGVAQRLGGRIDTHCTAIETREGAPAVIRWLYRQRLMATLSRAQRPWVITLEPAALPAWAGAPAGAAPAAIETLTVDVPAGATRTKVTGVRAPQSGEQTIRPEADLLFVAGAGWTKKQKDGQPHIADAERLILTFLGAAKASLGGSKSIVDLGGEGQAALRFMTHLHQVGQTGATPRHPKGLATCCHGEEPHVVGWRFINERRAINLDPNCGWAQGKADVLYVADAFEVMEKVNALLKQRG